MKNIARIVKRSKKFLRYKFTDKKKCVIYIHSVKEICVLLESSFVGSACVRSNLTRIFRKYNEKKHSAMVFFRNFITVLLNEKE